MNKFQRILWTVNGVLIFLTFLLVAFFVVIELGGELFNRYTPPQVIVGEELEKAKEEGLIQQGLVYESPIPVHGSTGYILPVSVKTYSTPRGYDEKENYKLDYGSGSGSKSVNYSDVVDILFLNANLDVIHTLLGKKAFISSFRYPTTDYNEYTETIDTTARHITYLIGLEDSNKDGRLDTDDFSDLYISDLNGDNFLQVTKGVTVSEYKFLNRNRLLIEYLKRNDSPTEHTKKYFATYLIKERKLEELTSLHKSLNILEQALTK